MITNMLIIGISSLIFLTSCSPNTYINPNYKGVKFNNKKLIIMPLNPSNVVVDNLDDLYDDYKEWNADGTSIVVEKLFPLLLNNAKKGIKKVQVIDSTSSGGLVYLSSMVKHTMLNNEEYIDVTITDLNTFKNRFPDVDFALFVSKIHFIRTSETKWVSGGAQGTAPVTFSEKSLSCIVQYVFWDYNKNDLVACGKLCEKSSFVFYMSSGNWENCVKQAGNKISSNNPF